MHISIKHTANIKIFTTFDLISQNAIERAARIGIKLLKEKKN
jgi:hypothetical protein